MSRRRRADERWPVLSACSCFAARHRRCSPPVRAPTNQRPHQHGSQDPTPWIDRASARRRLPERPPRGNGCGWEPRLSPGTRRRPPVPLGDRNRGQARSSPRVQPRAATSLASSEILRWHSGDDVSLVYQTGDFANPNVADDEIDQPRVTSADLPLHVLQWSCSSCIVSILGDRQPGFSSNAGDQRKRVQQAGELFEGEDQPDRHDNRSAATSVLPSMGQAMAGSPAA